MKVDLAAFNLHHDCNKSIQGGKRRPYIITGVSLSEPHIDSKTVRELCVCVYIYTKRERAKRAPSLHALGSSSDRRCII